VVLLLQQFELVASADRVVQLAGQELLLMLVLVGYTAQVVVAATAAAAMVVQAEEELFVLFGVQVALSLLQILVIFIGSFYAPRWRNSPL
jgi:Na+/phosphate symporter